MSNDTKKRFFGVRTSFLVLFIIVAMAMVHFAPKPQEVHAQAYLTQPFVFAQVASAGMSIGNTAGTVNNGGHPVAVAAASTALTANMNNCTSATYQACNFLIASSGGTVSVTTLTATATAAGVSLLGIIETGATAPTSIVMPNQINTAKVFVQ